MKRKRSNKTTSKRQLDLFAEEPRKGKTRRPKKRGAKRSTKKGKRRLRAGEVRTYSSKAGHRYELRRLS